MPVDDYEREIEELAQKYEQATILITGLIASLGASPSPAAIRAVSAQITQLLTELLTLSGAWIETVVPRVYLLGVSEAQKSMGRRSDASLEALGDAHTQSLQLLAEGLLEDMAKATQFMDSDAKKSLRDIGRRKLEAALAKTHPQAQFPRFREEMEERGVAFVDKANRRWKPGTYARTVLLTQTGAILNQAKANTALELGSPGVRIFDGGPGDVDEPCRIANGQNWSVRYFMANLLEHPRCRRAGSPLPTSWRGRLDRVMEGERREVAA